MDVHAHRREASSRSTEVIQSDDRDLSMKGTKEVLLLRGSVFESNHILYVAEALLW